MASDSSTIASKDEVTLKLDQSGLPLVPQPTTSPLDPLNYPNWLKYLILAETSLLGFITELAIDMINPTVDQLSQEFHISLQVATYHSLVVRVTGAVGPIVMLPLANIYGHRLMFLICTSLTVIACAVAAISKSFAMLIAIRGLIGISTTSQVLGVGIIPRLFFLHQRGRMMGLFLLVSFSGAHFAPIIGGLVATGLGWRWTCWTGAIIAGCALLVVTFFLPDTLFQRPDQDSAVDTSRCKEWNAATGSGEGEVFRAPPMRLATYVRSLRLLDSERMPARRSFSLWEVFGRPVKLMAYPWVFLPVVYCSIIATYASVGPLLIAPAIFTEVYHFDSLQNGLASGLSIQAGMMIGEVFSGTVTDRLIKRARKRALEKGTSAEPEIRLQGLWPVAVIVPLGLLIRLYTSLCQDVHSSLCGDGVGLYRRSVLVLVLVFYEIPLGRSVGYEWAFVVFAAICVFAFLGIVVLMRKGADWRKRKNETNIGE
ncbi:hypothetical protein NP233_g2908 [Leucocoprinus birnbaumii]|uniref:Major facilitator superfamily (MFS) profile domain-containing protein n=1 Tax=Leucocoprinus birnbaumii TaxID=56174 RepID=A0AAD5YYQ3_9AGAR|nr:hypothetical protein NP233_g2908 [Leucocoprinus birnbaumii]